MYVLRVITVWVVVGAAAVAALAADRPVDRSLSTHVTEHFVVRHTLDEGTAVEVGALLERLLDRYLRAAADSGFAVRGPDRPMEWYCTDRASDFRARTAAEEGGISADEHAFYSPRADCVSLLLSHEEGMVIKDIDLRRVSHESAHQLAFDTGLQMRGVLYPFWVSEGLATSLETAAVDQGVFGGDNPIRRTRLIAASKGGRLFPMKEFLVHTAPPAGCATADFYAQAWGAFRFLLQRDPVAMRRYLSLLSLRSPGRRPPAAIEYELVRSFGPMESLDADWRSFVSALQP